MTGIRVIEVAEYAAVPAAGAVLADWGADVIKVEHAKRGDPIRGVNAFGVPPNTGGFTYLWEPFNRGKRSIGLDLTVNEARDVLYDLVRGADVFLTNFLPATRRKLGIEADDLHAINPRLVYGRGSANGQRGEEAERGGFDGLTYWLRSGAGAQAMPAGSDALITLPAPGFGDIQTGMTLAGGISAALFHRERTGRGTVVDSSLLASGIWAMQTCLVGANISGQPDMLHNDRRAAPNPIVNQYRTKDGRFISLGMLQSEKYWAPLMRLVGRADLADDPRFKDYDARAANNVACITELDRIFADRTLAEWKDLLVQQDGQWTVAQIVTDLNEDQQAWDNGYLQEVDYGDGRTLTLSPAPIQFDGVVPQLRPAPDLGADSESVLLELGLGWDRIVTLKDVGALS